MTDTERELWRLVEVTKAISASLDVDRVLQLITEAVLALLKADTALIVLFDEHRQPTIRTEQSADSTRPTGKYSQTVTKQVLATGQPVFVLDTDLHSAMRERDSIQSLQLRTVVCAPFRSRGEIHGVLYAHSTNPTNAFTEQTKKLFLALCDFAAIAIDNARLYAASISDPMTKLYNHAYCVHRLDEELHRAQRYNRSLAVLLLDIDNFKSINDQFGHRRGDDLIHAVAGVLRASIRQTDVGGRYGGDEFMVIMPETGDATPDASGERQLCTVAAERIRERIAALTVEGISVGVTGSIGVATYPSKGGPNETWREMIERADKALYEAKRLGRNRICVAAPSVKP